MNLNYTQHEPYISSLLRTYAYINIICMCVCMRSKHTDDITHYINIHVSLVLLIPSGAASRGKYACSAQTELYCVNDRLYACSLL